MFKNNTQRLQIPLTSHVDKLPEKLQKRLKNSWARKKHPGSDCAFNFSCWKNHSFNLQSLYGGSIFFLLVCKALVIAIESSY